MHFKGTLKSSSSFSIDDLKMDEDGSYPQTRPNGSVSGPTAVLIDHNESMHHDKMNTNVRRMFTLCSCIRRFCQLSEPIRWIVLLFYFSRSRVGPVTYMTNPIQSPTYISKYSIIWKHNWFVHKSGCLFPLKVNLIKTNKLGNGW